MPADDMSAATTKAPEAARAFINFISSPGAAHLLKANGFEPG
jgi:ABC-type molybdate transport system substrate-binding protein